MNRDEIRSLLNRRASPDGGVLPHQYVDATDDIAAYLADECGRQAITTEFAFTKLDADETVYLFSFSNYEAGLDPWVTIDGGIDRRIDEPNKFILCYGRTGEFCAAGDTRIFASSRAVLAVTEVK